MWTNETAEFTLPDWAGPYLINGDASGLNEQEIKDLEAFEKEVNDMGMRIASMEEDSHFCGSNDLNMFGDNCSTFIAVNI